MSIRPLLDRPTHAASPRAVKMIAPGRIPLLTLPRLTQQARVAPAGKTDPTNARQYPNALSIKPSPKTILQMKIKRSAQLLLSRTAHSIIQTTDCKSKLSPSSHRNVRWWLHTTRAIHELGKARSIRIFRQIHSFLRSGFVFSKTSPFHFSGQQPRPHPSP